MLSGSVLLMIAGLRGWTNKLTNQPTRFTKERINLINTKKVYKNRKENKKQIISQAKSKYPNQSISQAKAKYANQSRSQTNYPKQKAIKNKISKS